MNEHQTIETRFYNRTGQMLSTAIEEIGGDYHYKPSRFLKQFNWIEEIFFSTTGSGKANRFYQRMTTEAAVDTNALAIKATLIERYSDNLDAVIRKHCVSIIPPTSGTRFLPNNFDKITTVEGVLVANSWVRPKYQPTGAIHMRRPDLWQQYLDRLCHRMKIAGGRKAMEAMSRTGNRIILRRLLRNGYKNRRKHVLWQCYCGVNKGQEKASGLT